MIVAYLYWKIAWEKYVILSESNTGMKRNMDNPEVTSYKYFDHQEGQGRISSMTKKIITSELQMGGWAQWDMCL